MSDKRSKHYQQPNESEYNEEAGHELGFFRNISEIKSLASLKVLWEQYKKQKNDEHS